MTPPVSSKPLFRRHGCSSGSGARDARKRRQCRGSSGCMHYRQRRRLRHRTCDPNGGARAGGLASGLLAQLVRVARLAASAVALALAPALRLAVAGLGSLPPPRHESLRRVMTQRSTTQMEHSHAATSNGTAMSARGPCPSMVPPIAQTSNASAPRRTRAPSVKFNEFRSLTPENYALIAKPSRQPPMRLKRRRALISAWT